MSERKETDFEYERRIADEKRNAFDRTVERYQENVFGGIRYRGASLSQILWRPERLEKLNAFLLKPKNFLVVISNPGVGKTFFCAALAEWILTTFDTYRYWLEGKLFDRLQEGFESNEGSPKQMKYLIDDQLIILDDVGSNGWTKWKEDMFFEFLDTRYNSTMPTIITSNLSRKDFYDTYQPRVCSRLFAKENTIIELDGERDYREMGK